MKVKVIITPDCIVSKVCVALDLCPVFKVSLRAIFAPVGKSLFLSEYIIELIAVHLTALFAPKHSRMVLYCSCFDV